MPITNVLSIFATEQAILGSEKRDVKFGSLGNRFNFKYHIIQDDTITLDFTEEGRNGLIHKGVEAILDGTEDFNINGFTGYVYAKTTIVDGIVEGDTPTIETEILQSVSLPTDIVNPPNYQLHTPLFQITSGQSETTFLKDPDEIFEDNLNWSIVPGEETHFVPELIGAHPYDLGYKFIEIKIDPDDVVLQLTLHSNKPTLFFDIMDPTFAGPQNGVSLYSYLITFNALTGGFTIGNASHHRIDENGDVFPEARRNINSIRLTKK